MKLTILSAEEENFGKYSCVAKNPRGQTDGSITLYGEGGLPLESPVAGLNYPLNLIST